MRLHNWKMSVVGRPPVPVSCLLVGYLLSECIFYFNRSGQVNRKRELRVAIISDFRNRVLSENYEVVVFIEVLTRE